MDEIKKTDIRILSATETKLVVLFKNRSYTFLRENTEFWSTVSKSGEKRLLATFSARDHIAPKSLKKQSADETSLAITSPLTGTVTAIHVKLDEYVEKNAQLVTITAMKMENKIIAPAAGRVKTLLSKRGDVLHTGTLLLVLEKENNRREEDSESARDSNQAKE